MENITKMIGYFNDNILYYPILIVLLLGAGIYFSFKTGFVQIKLFGESLKVVKEKPAEGGVTGLQALMVTVGSKVGTGNIIGVSTAICLGGYGAVFWMWVVGLLGAATSFIESTLAQIYKRRDEKGRCYGGPSYYMEYGVNSKLLGIIFSIALILTYGVGFNALASYNLQSSFAVYGFYGDKAPIIIGGFFGLLTLYCLLGGGDRILAFTDKIVPFMGGGYVLVAIILIIMNAGRIPTIFSLIFKSAFDFKAIFGGIAGSALMFGVKRGLYSNEAGIGSAPNAVAAVDTSHPVKQGFVQMLSTFIVTFGICTATALMTMASGVEATPELAGAPYVQEALHSMLGIGGNIFITLSLVLFAFTTIIGNLFYVDSNLIYLNNKVSPSKTFLTVYRVIAALIVFVGATMEMDFVWNVSDLLMGIMTIINVPIILILGGQAMNSLKDYIAQKDKGLDPVFKASSIGLDESKLDYWK